MTFSDDTTSRDAARVREIARIAYRDCDEAVAIKSFLEAGNTQDAVNAFPRLEAHLPLLIQRAMFLRLVMTISRLLDKPGTDRETLARAFRLLEQPEVRVTLGERGDKARLEAAISKWQSISTADVLKKIRAVRDYEAAHAIPSKAGEPASFHQRIFRSRRSHDRCS